jgi:hypothetical protein
MRTKKRSRFDFLFRTMSENEKLDEHMRNGTDYVNLPAHMYQTNQAPTWIRKLIKKNTGLPE